MTHRDYLAANLKHAPGCEAFRNVPDGFFTHVRVSGKPCTCPVADILAAWDAREEALTAADYYIYELENGEDWSDDIDHESNWNEARRALADLEGE